MAERRLVQLRLVLYAGCIWLAPLLASGCNVPVFRYALERWPADTYELVIFAQADLSPGEKELVQAWRKTGEDGLVNLAVQEVRVEPSMAAPHDALWRAQTNASLPWVVIQYPHASGIEHPLWTGPLGSQALKTLVDSPARREIVRRLCKGDSAVWLLLEAGDRARDQAVERVLEAASTNLAATLQLPEAAQDDPRVRPEVPLKIAFSTVRVSRANPLEQMLVHTLLRIDTRLASIQEPMAFAVFGRGRTLPLFPGKELTASILQEAAEFLTGACSCEVKSMNPGFDLLLAADWEGSLDGRAVKDPELPPLVGMVQAVAQGTNLPSAVSASAAPRQTAGKPPSLSRNLRVTLSVGIVFLVAVTMIMKFRARKY